MKRCAPDYKLDIRTIGRKEMVYVVTRRQFNPLNPKLPADLVMLSRKRNVQRISRKLSGCLLVIEADTRRNPDREDFRLKSAKLYTSFSTRKFVEIVREGKIYLDIRFGRYPDGRPHNHGTAWRIRKQDILELYATEVDLLNDDVPEDIDCRIPTIIDTDSHRKRI